MVFFSKSYFSSLSLALWSSLLAPISEKSILSTKFLSHVDGPRIGPNGCKSKNLSLGHLKTPKPRSFFDEKEEFTMIDLMIK